MSQTTLQPEVAEKMQLQTPWNIIVHNDPVNLMSYVTLVFQRVFGFSLDKAQKHMLEVHHDGRSIVWTGDREPAEHYVRQLQSYLLRATLEPSR